MVILLLYVDDIIITGSNSQLIQSVITALSEVFDLTNMGKLAYFLGLHVTYKTNEDLFIDQAKYVTDLIHKAGMYDCKPCSIPCKPHNQVLSTEGTLLTDPTLYQSLVRALQYLTFTRPDIAFDVNTVCQYMNVPTNVHFAMVKRIIRYLQGTVKCGLTYTSGSSVCDSDWAADLNSRRSIIGYVVYLGSNPVSWQSKKQSSVSRSSTEAEYRALTHTTTDIAWIRLILKDLHEFLSSPPVVYCDNQSSITLRLKFGLTLSNLALGNKFSLCP